MTPQERQLVDELFDRLSSLESAPRDPDAVAAISDGLRKAPGAVYALVQTVLLQDEALRRANSRIQELEAAHAPEQAQSGGFLDSMRETLFGSSQPRGSVPNVPPPESRPVWNSGQALQQAQSPGYGQGSGQAYGQGYGQPPYGQPYGAPPFGGGGSSFLGTAAAAAAGLVGGSLLLGGIRSMMGGPHYGLADAGTIGERSASPWSDQSGSTLARDAGIDDIGSGQDRSLDTRQDTRQGFFDQASNDDQSSYDDDGRDDIDTDADDNFGNDDDTDFA